MKRKVFSACITTTLSSAVAFVHIHALSFHPPGKLNIAKTKTILFGEVDEPLYSTDVAIVGAGPSGLSLAAEVASRNLTVHVIDPKLNVQWPNNYGVWIGVFLSCGA